MKKVLALLLLLSLAGCAASQTAALPETPPAKAQQGSSQEAPPAEERALSPVYTDWSKLTPYEAAEPLYTRHPGHSRTLAAREDYGSLLIYVGVISSVDNYIVDKLPLYGLVTAEGALVTDPVYAEIYCQGAFLLLCRGSVSGYRETDDGGRWPVGGFEYTAAAPDGSWVRELGRCYEVRWISGDRLAAAMKDGSVLVLNRDGTIAAEFPRSAFVPFLGADFQWNWEGGPNVNEDNGALTIWQYREEVTDGNYNLCYLDVEHGTVSGQPPEGWAPFDYSTYVPDETQEPPELPNYYYLTPVDDEVTGERYYYGYDHEAGTYDLLYQNGEVAVPNCSLQELYLFQPYVRAGLVSITENGCFCYLEPETGRTVFRYPVRINSD